MLSPSSSIKKQYKGVLTRSRSRSLSLSQSNLSQSSNLKSITPPNSIIKNL